jgi:hypothetical protein
MRPIDADPLLEAIEKASDNCRDMRDQFLASGDNELYLQWDTRLVMLANFRDTIEQMPTLE